MKDEIKNNEIQTAIEAGKEIGRRGLEAKVLHWDRNSEQFTLVPAGYTVQKIELKERPLRDNACAKMTNLDSFIRYINEWKTEHSRCFGSISEQGGKFRCYIDFPEKDKLTEAMHMVTYHCPASVEWIRWTLQNSKAMTQPEFALFLEDNQIDIIEPEGGRILEIALTLQAKKDVKFSSGIRLQNGQTQLIYQETIDGTAGEKGDMQIPPQFVIAIPPFDGGQKYKIPCRLRYRLGGGAIAFTFEMERPHMVIRDACNDIVKTIQEKTDINPFMGDYQAPSY